MSSPWQKKVSVTLKSVDVAAKTGDYDLAPLPPDPIPTAPDGSLLFDNDHHDGFDIDFVLTDKTGKNYAFPPNNKKQDAVSSKMGPIDSCPAQGTSDVFKVISVGGPNNSILSVHNKNQDEVVGTFSYVLWLTNDGGSSYIKLDPGGTNNNGMTS